MDWLIYISGWFWGWAVINSWICPKEKSDSYFYGKIIFWTMTWVWICWKFI